jgi:hypothetical protein
MHRCRYTWVNGSDPVQMRKLKMWREKLKPPPPITPQSPNTTTGSTSRKIIKDDLAQGSDDTISANRFREQDELR